MAFSGWRYRCFGAFVLTLLIFSACVSTAIGADKASEQEIQAAIIFKLIDFIEWPKDSFESLDSPFTIEIIGENNFKGIFESFIGRQVQERNFAVRHIKDINDIGSPQILIVSASKRQRAGDILARLAGLPILTIGDFPDFAELGGLINFYRKPSNRIGFEINLKTKEKSGLKISAFLMKMGKIVHPKR